jgi:hypothetical protein
MEEIDAIMDEMEELTPKSTNKTKTFSHFENTEVPRTADSVDANRFNSSSFFSSILKNPVSVVKPGHLHYSRPTNERYYDFTHQSLGFALIFNQLQFRDEETRRGSGKDADDLKKVFDDMGFKTEIYTDFTTRQIREQLDISE